MYAYIWGVPTVVSVLALMLARQDVMSNFPPIIPGKFFFFVSAAPDKVHVMKLRQI